MNRRRFLQHALSYAGVAAVAAAGPAPAFAIGEGSRFRLGILRYGGEWNPRPNGIRKMLQEVEKRTSISVDATPRPVDAVNREQLFDLPLIFWCGTDSFADLGNEAVDNLAAYLRSGGMLVIDSAAGEVDAPFSLAARRQLRRILPESNFVAIPKSHVLYKSFYLIPEPVGRVAASRSMSGVFGEDRALVLLNENDMLGAWSRDNLGRYDFDVYPGGERQREMSLRLGVNIVMYALCINYKEDQVHVPFILKRRKWRVD